MEKYLKYKIKPSDLLEELPIGCDRRYAMMRSHAGSNKLSLNSKFLYTCKFRERTVEDAAHFLSYVKNILKNGYYFKGTMLANTVHRLNINTIFPFDVCKKVKNIRKIKVLTEVKIQKRGVNLTLPINSRR